MLYLYNYELYVYAQIYQFFGARRALNDIILTELTPF